MPGPDDVIAAQVAMYGEPLAARFARLTAAFGISQARLAQVIGLSAPMLSQLASGQRAKISNPSVYARLLRLEDLAGSGHARPDDPAALRNALDEVAASQPHLTTSTVTSSREAAVEHLAGIASAGELRAAARAVRSERLAAVLDESAARASGP